MVIISSPTLSIYVAEFVGSFGDIFKSNILTVNVSSPCKYNYTCVLGLSQPVTIVADAWLMILQWVQCHKVNVWLVQNLGIIMYCDFLDYVNCLAPYLSYVSYPLGVNPPCFLL